MSPEQILSQSAARLDCIRREIGRVIVGQREVVDGVLIALMAGGHVLLEGVPGLGKTTLLRTLARVLRQPWMLATVLVAALARVRELAVGHAARDRRLHDVGVREPRELRRGVERIAQRLRAPLG